MIFKYNKKFIILIAILSFNLAISGCSAILRPFDEKKEEEDSKKGPPSDLMEMVEETEKIIENIEKVQEERASELRSKEEKPQEPDREKGGEDKEKTGDQQKSRGGQKSDDGQQDGQGTQQGVKGNQDKKQSEEDKEKKKAEVNWNVMDESIKKLHDRWNSFEPAAMKADAEESIIAGFEEQLNTLTEQIMARNEENTLVAANKLYSFYSEFLNLYKHMQPPEVKRVKYLVRQIIINGQRDEWNDTESLIKEIENSWKIAKARMNKPNKELNEKIDVAIDDFAAVAVEQKINLVKIKGDLLLKNLDQIK